MKKIPFLESLHEIYKFASGTVGPVGFLVRNFRYIFSAVLISGVVFLILAFNMRPIYTATAVVMPPQQSTSSLGVALGNLGVLAGAVGGGVKNPSDIYIGMLKSRSVMDEIIKHYDLKSKYAQSNMVFTRKVLEGVTNIASGKDGLIYISVDDNSPELAAKIANSYVEQLKLLNQRLAVTDAAQRRFFLEGQMLTVKDKLIHAELALKNTQEQTGLIAPEGQVKSVIEGMAALKAQIAAKDVEISVLKSYATSQNPSLIRLNQERAALVNQLNTFDKSNNGVGLGRIPESSIKYIRALRDFKYQEAMFELLSKQYELAKYDEAKDSSLVQVLDYATPPDYKSKPSRALVVIFGLLLGFVLGVLWAMLQSSLKKIVGL